MATIVTIGAAYPRSGQLTSPRNWIGIEVSLGQFEKQDLCPLNENHFQGLADKGYLILENALPAEFICGLRENSQVLRTEGFFRPAAIGQGQDQQIASAVRSDTIHWWDPQSTVAVQRRYWTIIEQLRLQLNRHLFLGLFDAEIHYAIFAIGSFYAKHLDQFRHNTPRAISMVLYLNEAWREEDGGQLRLYEDDRIGFRDVQPAGGSLVLFLSDRVYHEALPTKKERFSLTGWLKTRP